MRLLDIHIKTTGGHILNKPVSLALYVHVRVVHRGRSPGHRLALLVRVPARARRTHRLFHGAQLGQAAHDRLQVRVQPADPKTDATITQTPPL